MCLDSGEYTAQRFWSFEDMKGRQPPTVDELDDLIRSALRDTMTSDAGVALALSAGLDSSLLAALMAHEGFDVAAISVGFDDEGAQQEPEDVLAGRLAQRLSIPFTRRVISTQDVARSFAEMCWQRDEPIADITGSAYAALAETTRSVGRSVLVTGQGGDELFWGYPWVREAARAVALSRANREQESSWRRNTRWSKLAVLLHDKSLRRNYRSFALGQFFAARGVATAQLSAGDGALSLFPFHPNFSAHLEDQRALRSAEAPSLQRFNLASDTSSFLFTEAIFRSYLLNNGLAQTDRLSMAFSIENRSPLIFQPLVEAVVGGRRREDDCFLAPKALLKSVAARYLPDDVVFRQKTGFAPPVNSWIAAIRDCYFEEFSDPLIVKLGLVTSVASEYMTGVIPCDWLIWTRLATLELWLRKLAEHLGQPLLVD